MIIWNGKKLSQKKRQTQAAVKARVCADGSFWLGASRVNNLRYKHTYIYMYNIYIYIYIKQKTKTKKTKHREKWNSLGICKRKQR